MQPSNTCRYECSLQICEMVMVLSVANFKGAINKEILSLTILNWSKSRANEIYQPCSTVISTFMDLHKQAISNAIVLCTSFFQPIWR